MPDAQRRDKLPLMNGPTSELLALYKENKEEAEGKDQKRVLRMPVHPSVLGPFSKSHRILTAIFIAGLCPRNLPYTSRIRI